MRSDKRKYDQLRTVKLQRGASKYAEGSCLVEMGDTKVLCTASVDEKVPPFLMGKNQGWVTAEYGLLPRSTHTRTQREASRGKQDGRTQEIQRLIGRALRSVVDFKLLGERTVWMDCDVLQADGGTRCASITGAYVALSEAVAKLHDAKTIKEWPLRDFVAAVSAGIVNSKVLLDLNYEEDSRADVDFNFIMTMSGKIVEIQATAEKRPFSEDEFSQVMQLAKGGIAQLITAQKKALQGL